MIQNMLFMNIVLDFKRAFYIMIMEIKVLSFNRDEVQAAIMRQLLHTEEQGREFYVKNLVINEKSPISAVMTIERSSGRIEKKNLDQGFLAASMLRYCIDNKIPMARNSNKDLHVLNGMLSLFLSMETKNLR